MVALFNSEVVSSVDNEIRGINVISFNSCLKEFWMMDDSFFHEIDNDIL